MNYLHPKRGRALATSVMVAGACSFLAAQTTAVLLNGTGLAFEVEPVKGPDQTLVPVHASIEAAGGDTLQAIPSIQFRDMGQRDTLRLGRTSLLLLNAPETQGATIKVSFKVTGQDEEATGFLEYVACKPLDGKASSSCSLALAADSALAQSHEIVPLSRKAVPGPRFEGKDFVFFELREKRDPRFATVEWTEAGDDSDPGSQAGTPVQTLSQSTTGSKLPVELKDAPATKPDRDAPAKQTAKTSKRVKFNLAKSSSLLPPWGSKSTLRNKIVPGTVQAARSLFSLAPQSPVETRTTQAEPIGAGSLDPRPETVGASGANLWPADAGNTLAADKTPIVRHTLTFKAGEVAEGEVFTGEAFVRTKAVTAGSALIGIRFDCADGKSHFAGRMDAKIPTESRAFGRTRVGVHGKAPKNDTRITFSIQSRGLNPEAEAIFDSVTFLRVGPSPR